LRVLVTGGLGFVGSAICRSLQDKNDVSLVIIDNQSKGTLKNIEGVDCHFLPVDVIDRAGVEKVVSSLKPEIVIHLAAIHFIPECNRDTVGCLTTNIVGTENLLLACAKTSSVKRVIITSSQAIYPIKDSSNKEDDVPFPYDVYGESKLANEFQAIRFQRETKIDTIVVRLSNVYGPRETNPHVIPEIMIQLADGKMQVSLGNVDPKRDFIHSTDVARAYIALALQPIPPGFHLVNLGSGHEYSIREILAKLSLILGKEVSYNKDLSRYRSTERMHLLPDISRIHKLVGWEPRISIDQGLEELCRWYKLC
jgi:UDP-glucose 4-epimerase